MKGEFGSYSKRVKDQVAGMIDNKINLRASVDQIRNTTISGYRGMDASQLQTYGRRNNGSYEARAGVGYGNTVG